MKKLLFFLFISFSYCTVSAQSSAQSITSDTLDFMKMENPPQFIGGKKALEKFIKKNYRYPSKAFNSGIMGTVLVSFIINKEGVIENPKVLRPLDEALDAEAIKLITKMPAWEPGKYNGKNVVVKYMIPISYFPAN